MKGSYCLNRGILVFPLRQSDVDWNKHSVQRQYSLIRDLKCMQTVDVHPSHNSYITLSPCYQDK